ncbi:MAG: SGNH/GDSL hydrolase family protein [Oscillospiraceae bacterium]|nr:SGNH/GDSL hydrolase family protein [Oscillospiraceae bacterium]
MKHLNVKVILISTISCLLTAAIVLLMLHMTKSRREPRMYIALGDSVVSGYGVASSERYADVLFEKLRDGGYVDDYINLGVDGFTTTMLYDYLNSLDKEGLESFRNAEVITLNIGGNNILMPFLDYLPNFEEIAETITEIGTVVSDALEVVSSASGMIDEVRGVMDNFGIGSIGEVRSLTRLFGEVGPLFGDITDIFGRITNFDFINPVSLFFGPLPEELETELQKGLNIFESEFGNIIAWFERNAPEAVIIVNTVYNPLPRQIMGFTLNISSRADALTRSMNEIIRELSEERGFLAADIYSAFEGEQRMIDIMNFGLDLTALTFNFDIIHPNAEGHNLIFDLNYDAFKEKN